MRRDALVAKTHACRGGERPVHHLPSDRRSRRPNLRLNVIADEEFDAHFGAVEAKMAFAKAMLPFGGGQ
jgi:hypothetical protein